MARLTIKEGESTRIVELNEDQVSLGRATDNTVILDDSRSSRNHAVLRRSPTGFELIDLESRNGTKVNGIPTQQTRLKEGDVIRIGDAIITFTEQVPAETPEDGNGEEEDVGGLDPVPEKPRPRRTGRGRRRGRRFRNQQTSAHASIKSEPVEPPKEAQPIEPMRDFETKVEDEPAAVKPESKTEPVVKPEPKAKTEPEAEPIAPGTTEAVQPPADGRRTEMRGFHLLEDGRVTTFARLPAGEAPPISLDAILSDAGSVAPWQEIHDTEKLSPVGGFDRAGGALLMELKESDGSGKSLLFVDSAGILTVVEESSDTGEKAQRALIGKGINLAALLATEWTAEKLQKEFETHCKKTGSESSTVLVNAFGRVPAPEFWQTVEENLQAGKIRVLFLIREATVTIQKVIDFLFGSTNMSAYALQLEVFGPQGGSPRVAFTARLYGPSRSVRTGREAKSSTGEPEAALDIVGD